MFYFVCTPANINHTCWFIHFKNDLFFANDLFIYSCSSSTFSHQEADSCQSDTCYITFTSHRPHLHNWHHVWKYLNSVGFSSLYRQSWYLHRQEKLCNFDRKNSALVVSSLRIKKKIHPIHIHDMIWFILYSGGSVYLFTKNTLCVFFLYLHYWKYIQNSEKQLLTTHSPDWHALAVICSFTIAFQKAEYLLLPPQYFTNPGMCTLTNHVLILNLLIFTLYSVASLGIRSEEFTGLGGLG